MSIQGTMSAAVSALRVSSRQIAASADNVANAHSDGYRAKEVRATTVTTKQTTTTGYASGGVSSVTVESDEPGVNLGLEMIRQTVAHAAYRANAEVIKTAEEMARQLVNIRT